jgi:hypothetical protein
VTGPTRSERFRPLELLALAGGFGLFTGLVVLGATREPLLAVIFLGIAFIVALLMLAMFALAVKPDAIETADLAEQNAEPDTSTSTSTSSPSPSAPTETSKDDVA